MMTEPIESQRGDSVDETVENDNGDSGISAEHQKVAEAIARQLLKPVKDMKKVKLK